VNTANTFRLKMVRSNIARLVRRLVFGDRVLAGTATSLRNIVVWAFIALVAAFLTHPSGSPGSAPDAPVPWPAELGLDGTFADVSI
jgi:hypothetical protein